MKTASSIGLLMPLLIACSPKQHTEENQQQTKDCLITDSLAEYQDTIVGNFSGLGIDTLISEPIDSLSVPEFEGDHFGNQHYKWRIFSKSGRIRDLTIEDTNGIQFVYEGDLDGNGTDEWGFMTQWAVSNWHTYQIYTYRNGEWHYIVKPIMIHTSDFEKLNNGNDIAKPNNVKGQIHIKFSRTQNGEPCIIDTIVNATLLPISNDEDCIF